MISQNPNMAQCEPRLELRQRLMSDMNVKGLVSCPDKIDMRAIIPVYDFSPGYSEKYYVQSFRNNAILAGVYSDLVVFFPQLPPLQFKKIKIKAFYWHLRTDVAGRASLVGAQIYNVIRYQDGVAGLTIQFGVDRWEIAASFGVALELMSSSHSIGNAANTAILPPPDMQRMVWDVPIEIFNAPGSVLFWELGSTITFPANTFEDLVVYFTYE